MPQPSLPADNLLGNLLYEAESLVDSLSSSVGYLESRLTSILTPSDQPDSISPTASTPLGQYLLELHQQVTRLNAITERVAL